MRNKTYRSFRHMYALANVVCCNIRSVHPEWKNPFVKRNDLNVTISPRVKTEKTASISWSHTTNTDLVKPNETQPIQKKFGITNFFAKIPSSKSTEKKTEVTQVPPPKRLRRRKKWKKRGKERSKKRKIKRTIITRETLKGLLRIVASLIKNGQRKILAFSKSKKTPMPFLYNLFMESYAFPSSFWWCCPTL